MTNDDEIERLRAAAKIEENALLDHIPARDEIRELLIKYFVGPIRDEHVDRLAADFSHTFKNEWLAHQSFFESIMAWRGFLWKEEFSRKRRLMVPTDLLLLLGHMTWKGDGHRPGPVPEGAATFPQPKLFLPPDLVGTWQKIQPSTEGSEPVLWHLGTDGSFRSNDPRLIVPFHIWCCEREWSEINLVLRNDLASGGASYGLETITWTADEFSGHYLTYLIEKVGHRFRRV